MTIAPGLTWANNGADGGDLITAAATGGVAHPTGYPTYLLLARLFQFLPVGSIAFRTNLLSAVFAILAALLIYSTLTSLPGRMQNHWLAGLIAAFAFGLSQLLWSQAVITEVYALQAFFEILIVYLVVSRRKIFPAHPGGFNLLIGIVFGLAMGNHLTTLFLLPLLLIVGVVGWRSKTDKVKAHTPWILDWKSLLIRCLGIAIGLLIFGSLYFRAKSGSPINWGNPVTLNHFLWLVTGKLYQTDVLAFSQGFFMIKLRIWSEIILQQAGIAGLLVGVWGIVAAITRKLPRGFSLGMVYLVVVYLLFSFVYATDDSFVYLIFSFAIFSLFIGIGAFSLMDYASRIHPRLGSILGLICLVFLAGQALRTYTVVDASKNKQAIEFGERVMADAPRQALVFTDGDKDSFTLWYYQYVLKMRPDLAVIVTNLLPYDWYRASLHTTYPNLSIPGDVNGSWESGIMANNKNRPVCQTIVVNQADLRCSD